MVWAFNSALLIMSIGGCVGSSDDPVIEASEVARLIARPPSPDRAIVEHDFGLVLVRRGQTLRHEFPLGNETGRPLRVVKAEAMVPCCSAVGPLPDVIPPGGRATFPIQFRPGDQSGPRRVEFLLQTDQEDRPVRTFAVRASVFSEVEVQRVEGSAISIPVGRTGRQALRVICHRSGAEGLDAPDALESDAPLEAEFAGPPSVRTLADGLVETTREVAVTLPASSDATLHSRDVTFRWSDPERSWAQTVHWRVTPAITAHPPALVLRPSEGPRAWSVELRSVDGPFRVTGVDGPAVLASADGLPTDVGESHRIALEPRPDDSRGTKDPATISIATDHPCQAVVELTVLRLPAGGER